MRLLPAPSLISDGGAHGPVKAPARRDSGRWANPLPQGNSLRAVGVAGPLDGRVGRGRLGHDHGACAQVNESSRRRAELSGPGQ
jgi:hypothetical protein